MLTENWGPAPIREPLELETSWFIGGDDILAEKTKKFPHFVQGVVVAHSLESHNRIVQIAR